MTIDPKRTALVVVDVQRGFDDPRWGRRNNPACEENVARLLAHWRSARGPVVFVRHDSGEEGSPLAPGAPGNAFKDALTGEPDLLVVKRVHSAFHGSPDLAAWLRGRGIGAVALCGITTNHCCETTARIGSDLGFEVAFVGDATHTFDRAAPDGSLVSAEELQRATEASLDGEFANVVRTGDVVVAMTAKWGT